MATKQTPEKRKALMDYSVYAPLGAGQLLVEKTRALGTMAFDVVKHRRDIATKAYRDLVDRGEKLTVGIRGSAYTKRAVDQAKTARSQVRAARTSVRKAVDSTATATRQAAKKVG